ncbi:hypothetical protein [Nostoc sp.]|uniref:hypothetical protein n=1 Tax=Nostoc sp. TaxID=1180 RepID=UPI002FFA21F1
MRLPPPTCLPNKHYRSKEYLTPSEVRSLLNAAKERKARYSHRDYTGSADDVPPGSEVGEAVGSKCGLRWDAVMWGERQILITREKGSDSGVHLWVAILTNKIGLLYSSPILFVKTN